MKKFFQEFKEFAIGGNLIDMAVGVIVGGAFNKVVGSLVADVFTPALGLIFGSQMNFEELRIGGENGILIGNFINAIINFLIMAFILFCIIKALNAAMKIGKKEEEEAPKEDPEDIRLMKEMLAIMKELAL